SSVSRLPLGATMQKSEFYGPLERVNDFCWRIPKTYKEGMRVDGLIFADDAMIELIRKDQAPEQVANVAFLPGIQHASLAMPDIQAGVGQDGKYRFGPKELRQLMGEGVGFLKKRGLATESDIEHTEARGRLASAEPDNVSERALERGGSQCGTLGSGNHFLEVQ